MDVAPDLLETLTALVAIPSPNPPGVTREICAYVAGRLGPLGYALSIASEEPGCDNLIATLGAGAPHLVFNVHLDTVCVGDPEGWNSDPMSLTRDGDSLFGLGAVSYTHLTLPTIYSV